MYIFIALNFQGFFIDPILAKYFTLGKDERLKSRKSIEQLFSEGNSFAANLYRVFYMTFSDSTGSKEVQQLVFTLQFGAGVSTKNFKKAVDRNRIKRLLREAYRLQKSTLQKKLNGRKLTMNLFIIYTGKELPEYKDVYSKVNLILNKLDKILDEIK